MVITIKLEIERSICLFSWYIETRLCNPTFSPNQVTQRCSKSNDQVDEGGPKCDLI